MAVLPHEKCLRRAPCGNAIFCTLNGTPMLQANLGLLGGAQIVDWVRKETGVRRLHVVHGTHAVPEISTFYQLRDQDVLNIIFDSTDLPVLELHAFACRASGRVDIDLAHHRYVEDLYKEIQDFMQRLPCARWQLQHEELGCLLQSDQPPRNYLMIDHWVAQMGWQGAKRFKVVAREMLPKVCIRFSGLEEQWVDLDHEQVLTCSSLLLLVRRLAESLACKTARIDAFSGGGSGLENWIFRLQRSSHQGDSLGMWISDDDRYRHHENLAAHCLDVNEVLYVSAVMQENVRKRQGEGSRWDVLENDSNKRLRRLDPGAGIVQSCAGSFQAALHSEMEDHACKRMRRLLW